MPPSSLLLLLLLLLPLSDAAAGGEEHELLLANRRTLKPPPLPKDPPHQTKKSPNNTSSAAVSAASAAAAAAKLPKPKPSNSTASPDLKKKNTTATSTTRYTTATTAAKLPKIKTKPGNSTAVKVPADAGRKSTTAAAAKLPGPKSPASKNSTRKGADPAKGAGKSLPKPVPIMPWLDDGDDEDLISEMRNLPSRFHAAVVPDLRRISTTSKAYLHLASMEFTRSFKPLVGTRYAPPLASLAFALLLVLPLALVAVLFRRLHAHLPLQKVLLSAHIYLAVYFSVLAAAGAAAGTEPLRFFHAASPGAYVGTQVMLMMGYVTYLLLQLVEVAALGQTAAAAAAARLALGMAVGVHYYAAVFHRAVHGEAPRTSWRVHAVYAACFAAVCALAATGRGKKEYAHGGGGEDGKKS